MTPMTSIQAAARLGMTDRAVTLAVQRGALPALGWRAKRRGPGHPALLFDPAEVDAYARARRPVIAGRCDWCGGPLPAGSWIGRRYCRARCRQLACYARNGGRAR